MNQPLDFVAHDLEMMMPGGGTPMLTGGPMYQTTSPTGSMGHMGPGGYNSTGGFGGYQGGF